jgi:hypothetical protein
MVKTVRHRERQSKINGDALLYRAILVTYALILLVLVLYYGR